MARPSMKTHEIPDLSIPEGASEDVANEVLSHDDMLKELLTMRSEMGKLKALITTGNDPVIYSTQAMEAEDLRMESVIARMPIRHSVMLRPDKDARPNSLGKYEELPITINGVRYDFPVGVPCDMPEEMFSIALRAGRAFPQTAQDEVLLPVEEAPIWAARRFSAIPRG